jgi:hypothetical protein
VHWLRELASLAGFSAAAKPPNRLAKYMSAISYRFELKLESFTWKFCFSARFAVQQQLRKLYIGKRKLVAKRA